MECLLLMRVPFFGMEMLYDNNICEQHLHIIHIKC